LTIKIDSPAKLPCKCYHLKGCAQQPALAPRHVLSVLAADDLPFILFFYPNIFPSKGQRYWGRRYTAVQAKAEIDAEEIDKVMKALLLPKP